MHNHDIVLTSLIAIGMTF
ncbi:hypothetical protein Goarm_021550 [Gossypium armourianum]|uniref:Uncharacterized protein n=1 Tax=Gossypium armourianum TaxID=34283 RepID=A0A7J9IUQ9_9ROSI|nr:hypothetical protein [Gossypium armourianum]